MELNRHKEIAAERIKKIGAAAFDYDYLAATGLDTKVDLKPGSKFHDKLVDKALEMAYRSQEGQHEFLKNCRKMDWTLTGYVTPENANPNGNPKNRDRTIVVPMTFEFGEYFKAASKGVFIKDPIFKWKPKPGPVSLMSAAIMEYELQQQATRPSYRLGLKFKTVCGSNYSYGVGTAGLSWSQKRQKKPVNHQVTMAAVNLARAMGHDIPNSAVATIIRSMEDDVAYEGTELVPWDIYNTLRDPNTNPEDFQDGDFIGNRYRLNANEILTRERDKTQRRVNGQYVKALAENGGMVTTLTKNLSGRGDRFGTQVNMMTGGTASGFFEPVDIHYFEMRIIPKDWECGPETYPVRYQLELSGDSIITAFGPLDTMDDEYRVAQMACNTDGFGFLPVSRLFVTYGIQEFVDTMARCTEALAIKNVNGGWTLFNHNVANWDDVNNPEPAKMIRYANPFVTPEQAKVAIQQFQSPDTREAHMRHMEQFIEMGRRGNGQQQVMGDMPERPTQLGVKAATSGPVNALEYINWIIGEQFMTPVGWKMARNQVQYGISPLDFENVGRLAARVAKEIGSDPAALEQVKHMFMDDGRIDPMALNLDYMMEPYTGASSMNDDVQGKGNLIQMGMQVPEIAAEMTEGFGWSGMLHQYARDLGFETVDEYVKAGNKLPQMVVAPDQQVQENAAAGNRVPIGAS